MLDFDLRYIENPFYHYILERRGYLLFLMKLSLFYRSFLLIIRISVGKSDFYVTYGASYNYFMHKLVCCSHHKIQFYINQYINLILHVIFFKIQCNRIRDSTITRILRMRNRKTFTELCTPKFIIDISNNIQLVHIFCVISFSRSQDLQYI